MNLTKSLFIGAISYASYAQAAVAAIKSESAEQKYANGLIADSTGTLTKYIAGADEKLLETFKKSFTPAISKDSVFIAVEYEKVADTKVTTTNNWTVNYCYGDKITDCSGKKYITVKTATDKDDKTSITDVKQYTPATGKEPKKPAPLTKAEKAAPAVKKAAKKWGDLKDDAAKKPVVEAYITYLKTNGDLADLKGCGDKNACTKDKETCGMITINGKEGTKFCMTETACPADNATQVKAFKKFLTDATGQSEDDFGAKVAMHCGAAAITKAMGSVKVLASAAAGFAAIASLM
jgi:hypothetical protein